MKSPAIRKLRQKLAADEPVYGLWVTLESASITEMGVALGLDWVKVDAEHGLSTGDILEHSTYPFWFVGVAWRSLQKG